MSALALYSSLSHLKVSLVSSRYPLLRVAGRRSMTEATATRPIRPSQGVTPQERAALRAARKEKSAELLREQQQSTGGSKVTSGLKTSRSIWYASILVPPALIAWALNDENSPPAKLSEMIGLTALIQRYIDPLAKPSHEKLLPDWSQVSDLPIPP